MKESQGLIFKPQAKAKLYTDMLQTPFSYIASCPITNAVVADTIKNLNNKNQDKILPTKLGEVKNTISFLPI